MNKLTGVFIFFASIFYSANLRAQESVQLGMPYFFVDLDRYPNKIYYYMKDTQLGNHDTIFYQLSESLFFKDFMELYKNNINARVVFYPLPLQEETVYKKGLYLYRNNENMVLQRYEFNMQHGPRLEFIGNKVIRFNNYQFDLKRGAQLEFNRRGKISFYGFTFDAQMHTYLLYRLDGKGRVFGAEYCQEGKTRYSILYYKNGKPMKILKALPNYAEIQYYNKRGVLTKTVHKELTDNWYQSK